jgi:AraC-like DNA-binding protein
MGQWSANWVPDSAWLAPGYAEWAPPAAFGGLVACLWASVAADGGDGADRPALVLPDGCSDLIWEQDTGGYLAGPDTGPFRSPTRPARVIVGVRFRPAAGGQALGLPLSELRDQRVPLPDVLPPGRRIMPRLPGTLSPAEAAARVLDIAGRMIADAEPDPALTRVAALLRDPAARTEDVAAQVGLSERQLRRRCHAAAGYGPKTLQRILRFQRFVQLLDATPLDPPGPGTTGPGTTGPGTTGPGTTGPGTLRPGTPRRPFDLAAAAADTGYADQSHLTRECAEFSGLTPAELALIRRPARRTEPLTGEAA